MTLTSDRPAEATARPGARRRRGGLAAMLVALVAGGALIVLGPPGGDSRATPPGRVDAKTAWPGAQTAEIDPGLADGPLFTPTYFLDASTAVGTAPTPDATAERVLLRDKTGRVRELHRLPLDGNPQFETFTAAGDDIVWTESTEQSPGHRIWAADRRGGPARQLTADTGNALFFGSQYDLVIADGRVHWTAGTGDAVTEIRSVALTGGPVEVRTEPGQWQLSAWPWLVDETEGRLRDLVAHRDTEIARSGPDQVTCGPVWCRVMVLNGADLARVDVMHPDGSARRRIAGGGVQAAVTDVAVLDRFEIFAERGPDSDLTGTAGLVVHDIATGRTVDVTKAAEGVFTRGGVLWWSTGDSDSLVWHTIDLRTA